MVACVILIRDNLPLQDAHDRYYSPRYQAAAVHRKKGADYRAFILQGL